mgnify:FL=1|tara:strand:- start:2438 stop:2815 length:378 start_codon:yes stop_codon:yes gene_type:complete
MREFSKALAGFAAITGIVFAISECSNSVAKNELKQILDSGDYCTPTSVVSCRAKTYIVLEPGLPTLVDMLRNGDLTYYVHPSACNGEHLILTGIDGEGWRYCELAQDPNSFSTRDKLESLSNELR